MTPRARRSETEQDFTAIPYYAWANRGRGEMIVWIPNNESNVKHAARCPTIASTSKVSSIGKPESHI